MRPHAASYSVHLGAPDMPWIFRVYPRSPWNSKFISCQRREWKAQFAHDPTQSITDNKWCPGCVWQRGGTNGLLACPVYGEGPMSIVGALFIYFVFFQMSCHVWNVFIVVIGFMWSCQASAGHCEATVPRPSTALYHEGCTVHVSSGVSATRLVRFVFGGLVNHIWAAAVYDTLFALQLAPVIQTLPRWFLLIERSMVCSNQVMFQNKGLWECSFSAHDLLARRGLRKVPPDSVHRKLYILRRFAVGVLQLRFRISLGTEERGYHSFSTYQDHAALSSRYGLAIALKCLLHLWLPAFAVGDAKQVSNSQACDEVLNACLLPFGGHDGKFVQRI